MHSFAVRTRVKPLLFYTFDSTNSAISEKSVAMLLSSPNLSAHTPPRQRDAMQDYFLYFGGGTPVAILAYLDDFFAAGHDHNAMTLWAQQTRQVFNAMGFFLQGKEMLVGFGSRKTPLGCHIRHQMCIVFGSPSQDQEDSRHCRDTNHDGPCSHQKFGTISWSRNFDLSCVPSNTLFPTSFIQRLNDQEVVAQLGAFVSSGDCGPPSMDEISLDGMAGQWPPIHSHCLALWRWTPALRDGARPSRP